MSQRQAAISRDTLETQISVSVNLDWTGQDLFETGVPFLEHMLDQVARHGMIDMEITAKGDLHIDAHHTVEDIGITLGQAIGKAVSRQARHPALRSRLCPPGRGTVARGDRFFGSARPEVSARHIRAPGSVNSMSICCTSFSRVSPIMRMVTLHIDCLRGDNAHHIAETIFKAFGRAMRMALEMDPAMGDRLPSTKGSL